MQCKKFLMLSVKKFSIGKQNKSFPYVVKGFSMLFVKEFDCFPQKSLLLGNRFSTSVLHTVCGRENVRNVRIPLMADFCKL